MTPRRIARHVIIFAVIFLVLTAVAIWLDLGPVAHSRSPLPPPTRDMTSAAWVRFKMSNYLAGQAYTAACAGDFEKRARL
jgi:hypothetical protein